MKYIINSEKKIVTQKATMEKPELDPKFLTNAWAIAQHTIADRDYQHHIRSLKSFPAEWVRPDQDGKEVELDKDFRLQSRADGFFVEGNYSNTCVYCKKVFHGTDKLWFCCKECSNEIVAVAIPAQKEDGGDVLKANVIEAMEEMQKEMHQTIDWMMNRNPKLNYQDCVTTYLLFKISQLSKK